MTTTQTTADERTGEEPKAYHVLADGHLGSAVARQLRADGHAVSVFEAVDGPETAVGDRDEATDVRTLEAAGVDEASTVVVATRSDSRNLLIAQLVRSRFDVSAVVVLTHDPDRLEAFDAAGHDPVCATEALSEALVENA